MSGVTLQYENFENPHPELCLLNDHPRINLRQAFKRMAATLPAQARIIFSHNDDGIAARLLPCAGLEEPRLSYQFFSSHQAVVIRRIHAGEDPRQGIGTAMIASQLPFWQDMQARYIDVLCNWVSEGFYSKLGFERISMIPEYEWERQRLLLPMRLDLAAPDQKAKLDKAIAKSRPLTALNLDL